MLGQLTVEPSTRNLVGDGQSQRLEPRAMQVLVVLAQASPGVVGRVELNARVWGGRVVGEDAINRAVQTLRRAAAAVAAQEPFTIETIPRVGYRLMIGDAGSRGPSPPEQIIAAASPDHRWPSRTRLAMIATAIILTLGAVVLATVLHRPPPAPTSSWRVVASAVPDDLPHDAADATLSPDGARLAYRGHDARGRERIYVRSAAGGTAGEAVSPPDFDARRPAWSADGADLAFVRYEVGQPCRLYVVRKNQPAMPVGTCETVRDPHLAWSTDGKALMLGDAPGENAVLRIASIRIGDGARAVLSSPPGDSRGDELPIARAESLVFRRQFAPGDEGWIARDPVSGRERQLWRRRGVSGSVAVPLPDGALAIAWARTGGSGLDIVDTDGRVGSQPVGPGAVTALSTGGSRLLVEFDRLESTLIRAHDGHALTSVRGWLAGPVALSGGRLRFPITSAGSTRIWQIEPDGSLHPWGSFASTRIMALTPSPDERFTAALTTGRTGYEIVTFDDLGTPVFRWHPPSRALAPMTWTADSRHLVTALLDGAGWRLVELDPFRRSSPRDLGISGFAMVRARGSRLYAVRAGETTGLREMWRLDGGVRRLPIDLTLFDIVNWCVVDEGIWLPDRSDRDHPSIVLREPESGRVLRRVPAPGLAGPSSGLTADDRGPFYVKASREAPEYALLTLKRGGDAH